MEPTEKKIGASRVFILSGIVILVVIAVVFFGWNLFKDKFIRNKVKDSVYEKTNGLYTIRYDKMVLDEVAGYLYVTNLQIIPDTARFRQLVADKMNPPLVLMLQIPELKIAGVKTPEAMLDKKVSGRKLEINNASVIFYYANTKSDNNKKTQDKEMYQQLLGNLKEIQADTVEVNNVSLAFIDIHNDRKTIEASNISVHLKDVLIDSLHRNDSSRFFFAKHVQVNGENGIIKNKNSTYFYQFKNFFFDNEGGLFSVKEALIEPQLSEDKFAAFSKVQTDRFNIGFKNISLKHINLERLMLSDVIADSLIIQDINFKDFRDRSYPDDSISKVGQFPQQILMRMPLTIAIKKVIVKEAFIEYKEKNPKSDSSGRVQFFHSNAVISNLTNDPVDIKINRNCVVEFNTRFLDVAPAHVHLNLILNDPKGKFEYSGSMESFAANNLNKLTKPMGLAEIEKGNVNQLSFNFKGNDYGSDGKVVLLYDDLKLSLLKNDSADNKLKKKKLASFVANLVIKNSNPTRNQPARIAAVHYDRDTIRSFFNLMWKSLYAGVKQTAGM